jgi:hypothetical protein
MNPDDTREDSAPASELLASVRRYMHLDDVGHIYFALAVAVSDALDSRDPLWAMLVSPPSGGKSETIRLLDKVAVERVDDLTVGGLLSWQGAGKRARQSGLLARHPGRVFATITDFSTVLALSNRGQRDLLFSLLRVAYDGRVQRDIGGPERLVWEGRLTLLAGVTNAIDDYRVHADALGPRWLYLRLRPAAEQRRRQQARKVFNDDGLRRLREQASALAAEVVREAREHLPARLSERTLEVIEDVVLVTCLGRATVPVEGWGRSRAITGMATIEEPPRLAGQVHRLGRCLAALGLEDTEIETLCRRTALDSIPASRRAVLGALAKRDRLTVAEVARTAECHRQTAKLTLEELAAIGVAYYEGEDEETDPKAVRRWSVGGDYGPLIRQVFATSATETEGDTTCAIHPHNHPHKGAHEARAASPSLPASDEQSEIAEAGA